MNLKTTAIAATMCLAFTPAIHAAGETGGSGAYQSSSTSSMHMDQDTVRQVQQELSQKGYNPGPTDGMMGAQTKSALKEYQQSQGMAATGTLDQSTMDALGVQASTSRSMSANTGGTDGMTGTPNRSGSGYPTGDDRVTAPSTAKESGANTTGSSSSGSMSSGSSSGSMSSSTGGSDGMAGTPNRSGSGYPTGDDRVTAPSTAKESGANTDGSSSSGSMSGGSSSSGSMNDPAPGSDASGTASPNRSGSGATSGSDKPTAPATPPLSQ